MSLEKQTQIYSGNVVFVIFFIRKKCCSVFFCSVLLCFLLFSFLLFKQQSKNIRCLTNLISFEWLGGKYKHYQTIFVLNILHCWYCNILFCYSRIIRVSARLIRLSVFHLCLTLRIVDITNYYIRIYNCPHCKCQFT